MKKHSGWNYTPYKSLFFDTGDIYICRLIHSGTSIHPEWLPLDRVETYTIYCRVRN